MAKVYRSVGGKALTKLLAEHELVQAELAETTFEIAARAEVALIEHRAEGHAAIDIEHGEVDWYVILSDENGQEAALSIEYGRQAGVDEETGKTWTDMDGLWILHNASRLPRKGRKVKE